MEIFLELVLNSSKNRSVHPQVRFETKHDTVSLLLNFPIRLINLEIVWSSHQPVPPRFAFLKTVAETALTRKGLNDQCRSYDKEDDFEQILGQILFEFF